MKTNILHFLYQVYNDKLKKKLQRPLWNIFKWSLTRPKHFDSMKGSDLQHVSPPFLNGEWAEHCTPVFCNLLSLQSASLNLVTQITPSDTMGQITNKKLNVSIFQLFLCAAKTFPQSKMLSRLSIGGFGFLGWNIFLPVSVIRSLVKRC